MSQRNVSGLPAVAALACAAGGVMYVASASTGDDVRLAAGSLVVTALCIASVAMRWGWDPLRAPLLYTVLFALFHFGLVWTLGFSSEQVVFDVSPEAESWVHTPYLGPAVKLASLALVVFSAVCVLLAPKMAEGLDTGSMRPMTIDRAAARIGRLGVGLEAVGIVILVLTVASAGGVDVLSGGYLEFLENTQGTGFAYGVWAMGLGACISQLGTIAVRRAGLIAFASFAIVVFPLGLRGAVLFPAVALLATRALTGRRIRPPYLLAAGVFLLGLASVIRRTRVGGAAGAGQTWYSDVLSTVTELGFSLRPTIEVLRWQDIGFQHTWFVSFIAVPVRLVERITNWNGGPPLVDQRLFNVKVANLAGPIGGSPVAEAYDAAGWVGVALVMSLIAVAISVVSRHAHSAPTRLAVFPVVLLPLLIAVRNSFAPVLPQIAVGAVLVWIVSRQPSVPQPDRSRGDTAGIAR